jgi:hypothetical protein
MLDRELSREALITLEVRVLETKFASLIMPAWLSDIFVPSLCEI